MKLIDIESFLKTKKINYKIVGGSREFNYDYFCDIKALDSNKITWIKKIDKYNFQDIDKSKIIVFVVNEEPCEYFNENHCFIVCKDPKAVFFEILKHFFKVNKKARICPSSVIETKQIGKNVSIGCNCYICEDVCIGNNVVIKNNVVIESKTIIGNDCVIGSGTVIGGDGFGYYRFEAMYQKVPDFGGVIIGDNVEIGSNTCIDRGTLGDTVIKNGSKIDNLCHIAHNVIIDENCLITASSVVAGSTHLQEGVYVAPGSLIINQITVGKNSLVGMGSVVTKAVDKNKVVVGVPAKVIRENEVEK